MTTSPNRSLPQTSGRYRTLLFLILTAVGLSACSWLSNPGDDLACPSILPLKQASVIVEYRSDTHRTLADVVKEGEITADEFFCKFDLDVEAGVGTMHVELTPRIILARGPAAQSRTIPIEYFVTLLNDEGKILNKQNFESTVTFVDAATVVALRDEVIVLDVPLVRGQTGESFQVYIGFQLTERQIEENRERLGLK